MTTLEFPQMDLKLNLKLIDETACLDKKDAKAKAGEEGIGEVHVGPTWDYSQAGADWGTAFPLCAKG